MALKGKKVKGKLSSGKSKFKKSSSKMKKSSVSKKPAAKKASAGAKRTPVWKNYNFKTLAGRIAGKRKSRGVAKTTGKANMAARAAARKNWHEKMKNPAFRQYTRDRQKALREQKKKLGLKSTDSLYKAGKAGGRRPAKGAARKAPMKSKYRKGKR